MATINVTSTSDSGAGTLRQAITDLNAQVGSHTITFTGLSGTITLASALPTLTKSMTITGPGLSSLTVSGNSLYRVFNLNTGLTFSISGLTISSAFVAGVLGAGILNSGSTLTIDSCYFTGCSTTSDGGAISTAGPTTITNTSFVSCSCGISTANYGSAIRATNTITIGNCTFSGNSGTPLYAGGTTATVYNCTFSGNTGQIGGIEAAGGTMTLLSSTISGNTGNGGIARGVWVPEYAGINLKNSIISGNTGSVGANDFNAYNSGCIVSAATNIIGTISAGLASSAARVIGDPLLSALASNGGLTQTRAVSAGSVAIGAGTAAATNAAPVNGLDQRGTTRSATAPTIGAFEYVVAPAATTVNFPTSPSVGQTYSFNGTIWIWNGVGWRKRLILPSQDIFMSGSYGGL